ncbi:hypothetical protein CLIB1423_02S07778 [[Candida] railenensis]|uniref:6-phosphofructo-2-kinase domain-containing protein n=1 Tax=[Candida] railenensis TaxID=45579 RepID=A0A9P0QLK9_9ASCO|nr:hypothetical protein CLIB1423_02S07778 [[Candida] railenensis]
MVGLPARGKSYLSKQLTKYLRDHSLDTEIFNVGNTRRAEDGAHDASFFSSSNMENVRLREKFALDTLHELLDWLYLDNNDKVGIFDATNSTIIRRVTLLNSINSFDSKSESFKDTEILFLENIVDDEHIIHSNIISKLMLSPDYNDLKGDTSYDSTSIQGGMQVGVDLLNPKQIEAYQDFQLRLENYEKVYETIDTEELAILKIGKLNNNNIKMIKLYNYGGTFMRPGNISLYNVMTSMQLLQRKKPKQISSTRDYVSKILEFLLGYRYEYSTPPDTEGVEIKRNRINYHTVLCK